MLQGIETIFQDRDKLLKNHRSRIFEQNTEIFLEKYGHFFKEMSEIMQGAEDQEIAAKEISDCFVEAVKKAFTGRRGKIKNLVQLDLNLFMIYYVFPTILDVVTDGKLLAEVLCDAWNSSFTIAKIEYSDYETLKSSFNDKIFGII